MKRSLEHVTPLILIEQVREPWYQLAVDFADMCEAMQETGAQVKGARIMSTWVGNPERLVLRIETDR